MAFLFSRNRQRSNSELCKSTKDLLQRLLAENVQSGGASGNNSNDKVTPTMARLEELSRNLSQMKSTLQGTHEVEANQQQVEQLTNKLIAENVLPLLARSIRKLPFESRKDAQTIFSCAIRYRPQQPTSPTQSAAGSSQGSTGSSDSESGPVLSYIIKNQPEVVIALCNGYDHRDSAMPCGWILREALKHDSVAALILYDEPVEEGQGKKQGLASGNGVFWKFFDWIDKSSFETSADAFSTFRDILTKHKQLVCGYLADNYDLFFDRYNSMLVNSSSYVTKRQSINLLSTLLLERTNYTIMTRYIKSDAHLKLSMNLLRDDRRMVNYEAFHVFKIFVANPNKSAPVERILINNRERLLRFLPSFLDDRTEDVQFNDEKAYLIRQIENLPSVASTASSSPATPSTASPGSGSGGPASGVSRGGATSGGQANGNKGAVAA